MDIVLKILTNGQIQEFLLSPGGVIGIGRGSDCNLKLEDAKISSRHCRFFYKKDRLEISDLDSKNGTYLNGIRVDRSEVFIGDEVRIGDSIISLDEKKMQPEVVSRFTFPGPHADRVSYELKVDFTGARIQNQLHNKGAPVRIVESPSHEKEITLRQKAKSRIKLSKEEIRVRNKMLSFVTNLLDSFLVFTAFLFPAALLKDQITQLVPSRSLLVLGGLMVLSGFIFSLVNFKASKFTLGERFSGIRDLYMKQ